MPDIVVSTKRALELESGLSMIEKIQQDGIATGTMTARGRYALAKAGQKIAVETATYRREHKKLLESHAEKDDKGKPIKRDLGDGRIKYEIADSDALATEEAAMLEEQVTLSGVRCVTHAELGDFDVPLGAERLLLGVLIEDVEPVAKASL